MNIRVNWLMWVQYGQTGGYLPVLNQFEPKFWFIAAILSCRLLSRITMCTHASIWWTIQILCIQVYKHVVSFICPYMYTCSGNILGKTQFEYVWMILYIYYAIDTATACVLDAYIRIDDSQISWYPQDPTFFKTWVCVIMLYYFVCVDLRSSTVRTSGDHREPEPADAAGAERPRRSAHLGGRARGAGWDNLQHARTAVTVHATAVAAVQARVSAHVDACGKWTWKVIAKVLPV
jgi:hypothetical protein